ncbi:MAG: hypothetical protein NWF05_07070 [Candidatus Bathyarchaeota archaeon]|nr:hypothetical protein [Candidatus Bathyarchaeota archaeon]
MGRPSLIKPAIIRVLSKTANPVRFNDLCNEVEKELHRAKIDPKQFNVNLQSMVDDGSVEKKLSAGKLAYTLTSGFYEQKLKLTLVELLNSRKLSQLYDRMEGEEIPPFIVFLDPPAFDYKTKKPLSQSDPNSFGGGPMTEPGDMRSVPDWSNPSRAIASIMVNDFQGFLSAKERTNLIKLCRWAYWAGCRHYIESSSLFQPLEKNIEQCKHFTESCIQKFGDDSRRVEAEKKLLRILDLTEDLIKKKDLNEFLECLIASRDEHRRLLNEILCTKGPMSRGERLFTRFFEFGSRIREGLVIAELLHDNVPLNEMPLKERFFLTTGNVWDEFFNDILFGIDFSNRFPEEIDDFKKIKGSIEDASVVLKPLKENLNFLLELPFKRKIAITYLWGFAESILLSDRSTIRGFEDWRNALNKGDLDHREWLFNEKTITRLAAAYRAVKQHKEPANVRIDKEDWSLQDLYKYHPLGKDIEFWKGIIDDINTRRNVNRTIYGGGTVPKDVYEAFKRKETEYVEKMLDEEESQSEKTRRRTKKLPK